MPPRKVDLTKRPSVEETNLSSRLADIIEGLPNIKQTLETPSNVTTKPNKTEKENKALNDISDVIENARMLVSLPVLSETTITIQSLGQDIYLIDNKIEVLKEEEFNKFISSLVKKKLNITVPETPSSSPKGTICERMRCSRRQHLDVNGRIAFIQGAVQGEDLGCIRVRCATALPSRRR